MAYPSVKRKERLFLNFKQKKTRNQVAAWRVNFNKERRYINMTEFKSKITYLDAERISRDAASRAYKKASSIINKNHELIPEYVKPMGHIRALRSRHNLTRSQFQFLEVFNRSLPKNQFDRVISQKVIAKRMGVSERTVIRAQAELVRLGIISIIKRYNKSGRRAANLIIFSSYLDVLRSHYEQKKQAEIEQAKPSKTHENSTVTKCQNRHSLSDKMSPLLLILQTNDVPDRSNTVTGGLRTASNDSCEQYRRPSQPRITDYTSSESLIPNQFNHGWDVYASECALRGGSL